MKSVPVSTQRRASECWMKKNILILPGHICKEEIRRPYHYSIVIPELSPIWLGERITASSWPRGSTRTGTLPWPTSSRSSATSPRPPGPVVPVLQHGGHLWDSLWDCRHKFSSINLCSDLETEWIKVSITGWDVWQVSFADDDGSNITLWPIPENFAPFFWKALGPASKRVSHATITCQLG